MSRNPFLQTSWVLPISSRMVALSCVIPGVLLAGSLLAEPALRARAPQLMTVGEATDYQGTPPSSGRLGQTVTVEGMLINGPIPVGSDSSLADLQDASGGITLYFPRSESAAGVHRGDEVRVRGTIEQYEGQTEILVRRMARVGHGKLPRPRDVLAAELHGTRYLGQLVRVEGKLGLRVIRRGENELVLTDRSGEISIYLGNVLLRDPVFAKRVNAGGQAAIVGIANYCRPARGNSQSSGYRLIPRDPADFVFHPSPPYRLIAEGLALLLLIVAVVYLVMRRRGAERRARQMAALVKRMQESEKLLRQSEQRYRFLFERNLAGVYRSTLDGKVLDCNESFVRMLGCSSRNELLGEAGRAQEFYPAPSDRAAFLSEIQKKKVLTNIEVCLVRKDGTPIWVLENATLFDAESGSSAVIEGTVVDITERKHLEEQLRQTQKMEAIGQLAGGIGHDFNNLLTVIKGNSEVLLARVDPLQPLYKNASQIKRAADQSAALIRQLLAFSRMQVLQPKVLDLNLTVAEVGKMLPRLLREDVEVAFLAGAPLGRVKADPNQIEQVILNLAANARDAMPRGGKLTIETANADFDENYAHSHPGVTPGRYVMLSVTDTGMGMDDKTKAHIFEPFFTTKGTEGTGLGLATVYGIVKQSGGWIWVYSETGKGTVFKIYLPRVAEETAEVQPIREPRAALPRGTETILLADDQQGIRDLIRPFLEQIGYTVLEASHGEAALELARQHRQSIDLLLTDLIMPKMGGDELARRIVTLHPGIRVLYMSGYAEYGGPQPEKPNAGEFRLQKPFSMEVLAIQVREVLDTRKGSQPDCEDVQRDASPHHLPVGSTV